MSFVSTRPSNIEVEDKSLIKRFFYTSQLKTIKKLQIYRSFKERDLIKFESKVHAVASLGSSGVLLALGS